MPEKESLNSTHEWLDAVSRELGVDSAFTRSAVGPILDMTANVAHNGPSRPAAPTTAFLLGYALGRAAETHGDNGDASAELREKLSLIDALLERYEK
ncbi:DUF6457 domain-containing protein [Corynebacterium sp.]|uniref:DUF6457 domain-containing protein n=1 Tax=Corynebacterium sp. TaxID=1720 RepID=UPI002A91E88A|nr:DUF6457 domain-containing protein [Corynebacterium sp.]MDY5786463.1 DUF6457 domain-containing protein [Corynebacterium sp.]